MDNSNSKSIPKLRELAQQYTELPGVKRGHERAAMLADLDMATVERAIAAVYRNSTGSGRLDSGLPVIIEGLMLARDQYGNMVIQPVTVV